MDSGFLIALRSERDVHHQSAIELTSELKAGIYGHLVCSDYIFNESVNALAFKTKNISSAIELGEYLLSDGIEMLEVKTEIFNVAWELFKKRKNLSFTDCTTIELMKANDVDYLVSFDEGFKQFSKEIKLLK